MNLANSVGEAAGQAVNGINSAADAAVNSLNQSAMKASNSATSGQVSDIPPVEGGSNGGGDAQQSETDMAQSG